MVDFKLSTEQQQLRDLAHSFAEKEMRPVAAHHDETGEFPKEVLRIAWELGLMNVHIPESCGGLGLGSLDGCIIGEELMWGCTGGLVQPLKRMDSAEAPIIVAGNEAQQKKYLGRMADEFICVLCGDGAQRW